MQALKRPLERSVEENERLLRESEQYAAERLARFGDPEGNRHERRIAARAARRERAL